MIDQIGRESINDNLGALPSEAAVLASLLAHRFSCRGFLPQAVPRATLAQLFAISQMSASWCNSQPWQVIVTEGDATERFRSSLHAAALADAQSAHRATGAELEWPTYSGVYKERQREVGWQLYEACGIAAGDRVGSGAQALENFRLFGAPHALIVTSERDLGVYGYVDCGIYIANLLLAAEALGLGIIPQAALALYSPLVRDHFNIPDNRTILIGASLGFKDVGHAANQFRSRRASPDTAIQWFDN